MTMRSRQRYLSSRLQGFGTTIFATMSQLAIETNSVNLGQGFPDYDGPAIIADAAIDAIRSGHNQYPPGPGIEPLRRAVAHHNFGYYGVNYDPSSEVLITAGATEALASTLISLLEVGDEVIVFEPCYDSYVASIAMAGARAIPIRLHGPNWNFDLQLLQSSVGPRTRAILVNTPHNPTGKVFNLEELKQISNLALENDLLVITDEVYEHLVFEGEHHFLASFEGMRERTISISSAAKTFSFTGWKIGWVTAQPELLAAIRTSKQFLTYVNGAPFQHAIAKGLDPELNLIAEAKDALGPSRELLIGSLERLGLKPLPTSGTYFVNCDISSVTKDDALTFCMRMANEGGVVAIPSSVFYLDREGSEHYVRFAFCKRTSVIEEAVFRLDSWLN